MASNDRKKGSTPAGRPRRVPPRKPDGVPPRASSPDVPPQDSSRRGEAEFPQQERTPRSGRKTRTSPATEHIGPEEIARRAARLRASSNRGRGTSSSSDTVSAHGRQAGTASGRRPASREKLSGQPRGGATSAGSRKRPVKNGERAATARPHSSRGRGGNNRGRSGAARTSPPRSQSDYPVTFREKLASAKLTGWMVPAQPFSRLSWPEWWAWVLVYAVVVVVTLGIIIGGSLYAAGVFEKKENGQVAPRSTVETPVQVYRCKPSQLQVELSPPGSVVQYGQPVAFKMTLTNTSIYPCNLEASEKQLGVKVTSGDEVYYDARVCGKAGRESLLLDGKDSVTRTITWDGRKRIAECGSGDPAPAGSYRVVPQLPNSEGSDATVFQIK